MSAFDIQRILTFVDRDPWRECFDAVLNAHFGSALQELHLNHQELAGRIGEQFYFMVMGNALDDLLTRRIGPDGANLADDYLKRRGYRESATAKRYLQALRDSTLSLYEVSEVIPGQSFLARDLVRGGEPILISERTATMALKNWDRLSIRVLSPGSANVMAGGVLPFTLPAADQLLARIEEIAGPLPLAPDSAELSSLAPLFSTICLMSALFPGQMTATTSDGEIIELYKLSFPIAKGVTQKTIAAKLDDVPELDKVDSRYWSWIEAKEGDERFDDIDAMSEADDVMIAAMLASGDVLTGDLQLLGRNLTLSTLSASRAERGRALVEAALGDMVGPPTIQVETLDDIDDEFDDTDQEEFTLSGSDEDDIALTRTILDSHYANVLDDVVPMLGNQSPRAAAQTAEGKIKVADWLKFLENTAGHHAAAMGQAPYDFTWMWENLGILDLRR